MVGYCGGWTQQHYRDEVIELHMCTLYVLRPPKSYPITGSRVSVINYSFSLALACLYMMAAIYTSKNEYIVVYIGCWLVGWSVVMFIANHTIIASSYCPPPICLRSSGCARRDTIANAMYEWSHLIFASHCHLLSGTIEWRIYLSVIRRCMRWPTTPNGGYRHSFSNNKQTNTFTTQCLLYCGAVLSVGTGTCRASTTIGVCAVCVCSTLHNISCGCVVCDMSSVVRPERPPTMFVRS